MVVPNSKDKMYYPSDDMKRDAHVPDFNSYLELYKRSLENPEGRSSTHTQCICAGLKVFFNLIFPLQFPYFFIYFWSMPETHLCAFFVCNLQPVALMQMITSFQVSGKMLLMNSFGRVHQQDQ